MKKQFLMAVAMAVVSSAHALNWGSIPVQTDLTTALSSAKAQTKMLFVLLGTDSCHYCSELKNYLGSISGRMNANYVMYYCNAQYDKSMDVSGGYPRWGVFNPFNFEPSKKWNNTTAKLYAGSGWYGDSYVASALTQVENVWASASKTLTTTSDDVDQEASPVAKDVKLAFYIDDEFPTEFAKYGTVIEELLPTKDRPEAATLTTKMKMTTEKGAKVTWTKKTQKLTVDQSSGKTNISSLKLSFSKRKGMFKGSFKIYAINAKGTMKKVTVKIVDGNYANGVGTATAMISGVGGNGWPVRVEAVEE